MDQAAEFSEVAGTALIVAGCRVRESRRPDAWFVDPLALHLAEIHADWDRWPLRPGLVAWLAVRTRFLDELVLGAFGGSVRQLVIAGAGLDARAFRLPLDPTATVFEIDRSDVLSLKDSAIGSAGLTPVCQRRVVVADVLLDDLLSVLHARGWRSDEPTVWIAEGFLVYFEQADRERILKRIAAAGSPSDILGATMGSRQTRSSQPLWGPRPVEDSLSWFARCGWSAQMIDMATASARYGRPASLIGRGRGELIRATKNVVSRST